MAGGAYTIPTIGITGSPKDYTGIVAARQRQEVADKGKAAAEQKKEDAEIYKAVTLDASKMLPLRMPAAKEALAKTIKTMQDATLSGDYAAREEAKTTLQMTLGNFAAEKVDADKAIVGTEKGTHLSTGDLRRLYSASKPEDVQDLIDSGDVTVQQETGRLVPTTTENIDFTGVWKGLGATYKNKHSGKVKTAEDGTEFFELSYDLPGLQAGLAATYENEPSIKKKALLLYKQENDTKGMTPEQVSKKAKENFVANGLEFGSEGEWQRKPSDKGINVNVNIGGGGDGPATPFEGATPTTKIVTTDPLTNDKQTYETNNKFGYSFGDISITAPVPGGAVYVDSGEKVNDADVRTGKFNQFLGKILLKKDWKNPINGVTYPKGSAIPKEYEEAVIDAGLGQAGIVAMGLANGQSIQYDAKGLNSSAFSAATEKEKELVVKQLDQAKKDAEALQAKIDRQYLNAKKRSAPRPPAPKPDDKAKDAAAPKGGTRVTKEQQKMLDEL